jgi:hypothetical protein
MTGLRVGVNDTPGPQGWSVSFGISQQASASVAEDEALARKLGFEDAAAMQLAVNRAILAWVPRVMFVLLPFFAWLVALAYRKVDRHYLHHLIFAVHVHAAWFAAGTVAKAVEIAAPRFGHFLEPLVIVFAVAYVVLAFRRVYGRARFSFARTALVLAAYSAVFVLAVASIVVPVVFQQVVNAP